MEYPTFVSTLFKMTESSDDSAKVVAFETIGYVGISLEGKVSLAELGNKMTDCIEKFGGLIMDAPSEMRIRTMNAFSSLVKLDKENQTDEFLSITESWYRRVSGRPMEMMVNIAKQPFEDLRLAAFQMMLIVAGQNWGRREICRHPGLLEYLLDRGTERVKSGKESKYAIISVLANSGDILTLAPHETLVREPAVTRDFFSKLTATVGTAAEKLGRTSRC